MIEYSGITHEMHIKTLDDGTYFVTTDQEKIIDPVLNKTKPERIEETASDEAELKSIVNRAYPKEGK